MAIASNLPGESPSRNEPIVIGIVNNMPEAALLSTERQFHNLLSAASRGRVLQLRHFTLPELPRSETAHLHIKQRYEDLNELWADRLDGMIVTGTEPRASELADEPYWGSLTKLIDWSAHNTLSTVWSCLSAHAAVFHLDGIGRRRLPRKLFGIFDCVKASSHRIVEGVPDKWSVPHSRHNNLPEEALVSRGYSVLSRSSEVGADSFVKNRGSLDVFFQGHPEYEPDTLLREYRRDVGRFLSGEMSTYPEMPCGYFNYDAVEALSEFGALALRNRKAELLQSFPMARVEKSHSCSSWEQAVQIYTNWIGLLAERKYESVGACRQAG